MVNLNYKLIVTLIILIIFPLVILYAQNSQQTKLTWEDKLYEKDVDYDKFACRDEDKSIVVNFFKKSPPKRGLPICHNNCAILKEFSKRPMPRLSAKIKGVGNIGIHVLANEDGKVIYARAINGHPLIQSLLQKRACESTFKETPDIRHKLLLFCPNEDCKEMQPIQ